MSGSGETSLVSRGDLPPVVSYTEGGTVSPHCKTYASLELIKSALVNNELFKTVEPYCIRLIADRMLLEEYLEGETIIPEGSPGTKLYVVEYGLIQVSRKGGHHGYLSPGHMFGELALFFHWQHTVTFKAASGRCQLWALDGGTLQQILARGWKQHTYVEFMTSLPLFKHLQEDKLVTLSWQVGEREYLHGEYIIRQGTSATDFFVIQRGRVKVTKKEQAGTEKFIRVMYQGEFFGEKALLNQQQQQQQETPPGHLSGGEVVPRATVGGVRTANVIVDDTEGVSCLVIDRQAFYQFFRGLELQVARRY